MSSKQEVASAAPRGSRPRHRRLWAGARAQVNGAASLLSSSQRRDGPEGSPERAGCGPLKHLCSGGWPHGCCEQWASCLLLTPLRRRRLEGVGGAELGRPVRRVLAYVANKVAHTLGQLAHRRLFQRQAMPQAARRFGRPRPISRLSRAGRPHRTCCRHGCSPGPEAASSTRRGSVAPGGGLGRRRCSACAVHAQRRGSGVGSVFAAPRQRIRMPLRLSVQRLCSVCACNT